MAGSSTGERDGLGSNEIGFNNHSCVRTSSSKAPAARNSLFDIQHARAAKPVRLKDEGFRPDKWKNKKGAPKWCTFYPEPNGRLVF
jgi:hypothetical protein